MKSSSTVRDSVEEKMSSQRPKRDDSDSLVNASPVAGMDYVEVKIG